MNQRLQPHGVDRLVLGYRFLFACFEQCIVRVVGGGV